MGHEHDFTTGHHGEGIPAAWGAFGLIASLLVLGIVLARNAVVRARLLAFWELVRQHPAVTAVWGNERAAGQPVTDEGRTPAPARSASTPVTADPRRLDPVVIAPFPPELREVLLRTDELAAGLTVPAAGGTWPGRALAEHRLETVRVALVDLVDTFAQIPPDLAVHPAACTGTSPLEDALAAGGLLEQESRDLRNDLLAGVAAELRRQRAFLADKYGPSEESSTLHLP